MSNDNCVLVPIDLTPGIGALMTELELIALRQFRGARISRRIEWGRSSDCIWSVIAARRSA